jgi:hypothetical protein
MSDPSRRTSSAHKGVPLRSREAVIYPHPSLLWGATFPAPKGVPLRSKEGLKHVSSIS